MNAEEARNLNLDYIVKKVGEKYKEGSLDLAIKAKAMAGITSIRVDTVLFDSRIREPYYIKIKEEYEEKGFKVIRTHGFDHDDNWDYITISW